MGARIYDDFHRRMHALTENAAVRRRGDRRRAVARRCYLVDTAGYAIWAPQFSALNLDDKRSFQSVPSRASRAASSTSSSGSAPTTRATRRSSTRAPARIRPRTTWMPSTDEGAFPPAEEVDAHYPGSPTLDYFKPWANTRGCVQDVVYYDSRRDRRVGRRDGRGLGRVLRAGRLLVRPRPGHERVPAGRRRHFHRHAAGRRRPPASSSHVR